MSQHTSERVWSDADMLTELRAACAASPSQAAWSREHGFTPAFVNDVLAGRRAVNSDIANALGFFRRVTYHLKERD